MCKNMLQNDIRKKLIKKENTKNICTAWKQSISTAMSIQKEQSYLI